MTADKKGYLYVIGPEDGPYKIGHSQAVGRRVAECQVGNHQELIVHRQIRHESPDVIEARIHERLEHLWIRGEWFEVTLGQFDEAYMWCTDENYSFNKRLVDEAKDLQYATLFPPKMPAGAVGNREHYRKTGMKVVCKPREMGRFSDRSG